MARSPSLIIVALGAACAAALLFAPSRAPKPTGDPGAAASLADELDGRLREVAAGLDARAATLADLPRLQAAVATDAATVRDLTQDELAFRPKKGEVIEIGQIPAGGKPVSLWRSLEGDAPAAMLDQLGYHAQIVAGAAGGLYLTAVVEVKPRERNAELKGAIALSWPVETQALADRVSALHVGARIELSGAVLGVGELAIPDGAPTVAIPLKSAPGKGLVLRLQTIAPPPARSPLLPAALVLALSVVVAGGLSLVGGRRSAQGTGQGKGRGDAQADASRGGASIASPPVGEAHASGGTAALAGPPQPSSDPRLSSGNATTDAGLVATGSGVAPRTPPAAFAKTEFGGPVTSTGAPVGDSVSSLSAGSLKTIGRYAVIRHLGSGGMADVYLARSTGEAGFEKLIALKVLQKQLAREPVFVEHFLDEARLATNLTHPNIVQISDLGHESGEYFIAMEYIDGADLEHLLADCRARGSLPPVRVAISIIRKICDGLHAAHVATSPEGKPLDLVHRDVKAANVFVARNGVVKIGDFGIAKANQESRIKKTEFGQVKGTAAYMAPEHRQGLAVDRRADLYSVGAIAYEAFTGAEVNLDVALIGPLGKQGWPHLPPPSKLRPELPPELDAVIWKALSFEKHDRYESCEAMETALEEIANRHGLGASDKVIAQWVVGELAAARDRDQAEQVRGTTAT